MAKIIPYQIQRFQPIDFKRADEQSKLSPNGQLNLFDQNLPEIVPIPLSENAFDLALKFDLRNDPSAEKYYWKSIEKKIHTAHALCNLGVIAAHQQKMVDAIDLFTQALLADPRHSESHFNLANVYFVLGNFSLAILHFKVVTKIAPDFEDVYYNLGLAYLEKEDFIAAKACFEKYKSLNKLADPGSVDTILTSLASLV